MCRNAFIKPLSEDGPVMLLRQKANRQQNVYISYFLSYMLDKCCINAENRPKIWIFGEKCVTLRTF